MNEIDWVIAAVLLLSTILGVSRGVVREVFAIFGWALAIWLSMKFAPELAEVIPLPGLSLLVRTAMAALGIVIVVLFTCGIASKLIGKLLRAGGVSFEDRAIGSLFGFVRGVVIVCLCVFLAGMTSAVKTGYWRNSVLIVPAEQVIDFAMPYLPQSVAQMRKNYKVS
ncbi:MAG: CvpA family protein [Duodenibacillus sp.]|nr:CvpA family protein [Duodenibacillus sp.]HBC70130.1 CvpA family protein [Sutterella sp.]